MSKTTIEWTDLTWNPGIYGCSKISPACTNCYAMGMARRLKAMGKPGYMSVGGVPDVVTDAGEWTGEVRLDWPEAVEESAARSLPKRKPARVFVTSMADLFHEEVSPGFIDAVFTAMEARPHLTFQVLTKRASRMAEYAKSREGRGLGWPSNVWAGTTVEDQKRADERIPYLLRVPAQVRFLSCEPLLGSVDLDLRPRWRGGCVGGCLESDLCILIDGAEGCRRCKWPLGGTPAPAIGWVIAGGESGQKARPSHPDWFKALRDQCVAAGVPFFMKQAGSVLARQWGCEDGAGGDDRAWPADLAIRQVPEVIRG